MSNAPDFRLRPGLVLSLMAGRGSLRITQYAANTVLFAAWGRTDFARYAAALGAGAWLMSVVAAGPEKASLKLLPRAGRARADLLGGMVALACVLPVLALAATGAALLIAPGSTATLYVIGAASSVAGGANLLLVGLHRALGRPRRDMQTFLALTAATVLLTVLVLTTGLSVRGYLVAVTLITAAADAALLPGLGRPSAAVLRRPALRRLMVGTTALMGASEVLSNLALSGLYLVLAGTAYAVQTSELYLVGGIWSLGVGALYYLLRLFQPRIALAGARAGRRRALTLARWVAAADLAWLAAAAAVLAVLRPADWSGTGLLVLLGALMAARAPLFVATGLAATLVENSDGRGLRASAAGAVAGTVAVLAVGLAAAPVFGAAGAVLALAVKELAVAGNLLRYGRAGSAGSAQGPVGASARSATARSGGSSMSSSSSTSAQLSQP